ncbi:ATP-grasp domain-containing protein [uncultured Helicobacter sp.]|uniref:ATP-grasp domain-containing protein n=1 Tax=uncultured Helicobacter sp. TaxID=175537 RepID=UPI00260509A5|nr:ATP-grasp domain-containing protein [uncultured Helicobacter sp.]
MNKLRIFITTIGGLTSPDCLLALRNNGEREVFLYGSDSFSGACGRKFVDIFEQSPDSAKDTKGFIDFMLSMVKKYQIDVIIPCGNDDNLALSQYKKHFDIPIMVGEYEDLVIAYDKLAVYENLKKELPQYAPKYHLVSTFEDFLKAIFSLGYPHKKCVIKPRLGRGGRGVYILSDSLLQKEVFSIKPANEMPLSFFESILKDKRSFDDLIIMEYLQEPFVSAYSLCQKGKNIITMEHIREWGNASQTYRGYVRYNESLEELCSHIIQTFSLDYTNNMELAHNENASLVLFDLNPRLGASSGVDTYFGLNFPYFALKLALGENIHIDKNLYKDKQYRFYRYFTQWWENML